MRPIWLTLALSGCVVPPGLDKTPDTDATDLPDSDTLVDSDTVVVPPDTDDTDVTTLDTAAGWSHTLTVDGDASDWLPGERFVNSAGTDTWISWDDQDLFVAIKHPDVGTGAGQHWVVITLGNDAQGAIVGSPIRNQQPALPFEATRIIRWKANNSYHDIQTWDGVAWVSTADALVSGGGAIAENDDNQVVEFRIPRALVGITDTALVHVHMVFEGAGFETSYAAAPATSFADGTFDPDVGAWYAFDLTARRRPNRTTAQTGAVLVDTDETDLDTDATDVDTDLPLPTGYRHTITADGDLSDWNDASERFAAGSSSNHGTWLSWDEDNVYVGVRHPDVATGTGQNWVVLTLGNGAAGAPVGAQLGTQLPDLDVPATHILRWKADDSYTDLGTWNGAAWTFDADWRAQTGGVVAESNVRESVEFVIPRDAIGAVDTLVLHANWVYEGAGFEASYAPTPPSSFADGAYDPDYTAWYAFDLGAFDVPTSYAVQPLVIDTDTDTDVPVDSDTDLPPWSHTITVDGNDDEWFASETFPTTTAGSSRTFVTWDATHVYVGAKHPDVATGGPEHWLVITAGNGDSAAPAGSQLGTQLPAFGVPATHMVRWKADNSYTDLGTWDGAQWGFDSNWRLNAGGVVAESNLNQTVEVAIPRSALGNPDLLDLHVNWVFEGAGFESSYGVSPTVSFAEGVYDPDYTAWFTFDLTGPQAPGTAPIHTAIPVDTDTDMGLETDDTDDTDLTVETDDTDDTDLVVDTDETDDTDLVVDTDDTDDTDLVVDTDDTDLVVDTDETDDTDLVVDTDDTDDTDLVVDTDETDTDGVVDTDDTDLVVDTDDTGDTDTDGVVDSDTDVVVLPPFAHTITVDGDPADWFAGEQFATTAGGTTRTHITWDDTMLYVGVRNPDVASGGNQHWVVVHLSGNAPFTTVGEQIGTQLPGTAMSTTHILRWKADDSYTDLGSFDGAQWSFDSDWRTTTGGAVAESNAHEFMEFAIPLAVLGNPVTAEINARWVFEGAGFESTYAGSPSDSFVDGSYDPDLTTWFQLDLTSPDGPPDAVTLSPGDDTAVDTDVQPWFFSAQVDGSDADWFAGATFPTTAGGNTATLITWDDERLYVGSRNPNVTTGGGQHWFVVSLGTQATATTVGSQLGTQTPQYGTPANIVIRWKADNSYTDLGSWNGASWSFDPGWLTGAGGALAESDANGVVEWSIPWAALGNPTTFTVQAAWMFEGAGFESTFAGTPSTMFPDGAYLPFYASWYAFDRTSPQQPGSTSPSP